MRKRGTTGRNFDEAKWFKENEIVPKQKRNESSKHSDQISLQGEHEGNRRPEGNTRVAVEGLSAAQKGKNREGLSPEMRAINTEVTLSHAQARSWGNGEMGKWGNGDDQTEYNNIRNRVMRHIPPSVAAPSMLRRLQVSVNHALPRSGIVDGPSSTLNIHTVRQHHIQGLFYSFSFELAVSSPFCYHR